MAKTTAIVVTIIGLLLLLEAGGWIGALTKYDPWLIALGVLIIGVTKLIRNFSK
jgi:hypothetical protein